MSRKLRVGALSALLFVANTAVALAAAKQTPGAAGGDPSKVGDAVKSIVSPNAKALWWVALVGGLLFMAFSRRASRAAGAAGILLVSGIAIFNPAGVATMISNVAQKVV